jgi:hypothetical protein
LLLVLILAGIVATTPLWLALERSLVLRAAGATRRDVRRGYVRLERGRDGILVVRPGARQLARIEQATR